MIARLVGTASRRVASAIGRARPAVSCAVGGGLLAGVALVLAPVVLVAQDPEAAATDDDSGVALPTDRQQERLLDRARRLVAEGLWSDAATSLDEILGADRDFFIARRGPAAGTSASVKSEAMRVIGGLPPAGRAAYELQFRARAERALAAAIAADDTAAIVAVARRWFATPAGRRAALLVAVNALEAGQPLAAAAWLDRLADVEPPTDPELAVMRALARDRAGDAAGAAAILDRARTRARGPARIAGREVAVSFPPGRGLEWLRELCGAAGRQAGGDDWLQPRGDAGRNALAVATRPLLVSRYRVPLTHHPEEARLLEKLRRELADRGGPQFPAATPLAVAGTILARSPLGLLAVDFATGKRIWLQPGPRTAAVAEVEDAERPAGERTFADFTSGGVASDGRLAFVVESHPEVLSGRVSFPNAFDAAGMGHAWRGGNTLSAYDIAAAGRLAWRLPAQRGDASASPPGSLESAAWFAGPPLVAGGSLHVIVEENAEIRLDVLDAADGRGTWSQPLAELDEQQAVAGRGATARRLAGLTPALGDGVLVCPLGIGTVVAVDLANRTLLWAYAYDRSPATRAEVTVIRPGGLRQAVVADDRRAGWCDDGPVIAAGRVLLTPRDSEELHCLDLRDGRLLWKQPRAGRLQVAGVVDGRVYVVSGDCVEAFAADGGRRLWRRELAAGVRPSGRGILTADRLFLPLDTPEVVELALADGAVVGRSPARGGAVPGNLIAYRGEVISLGVDAIDVFHQAAALEERIERAGREPRPPTWSAVWRAHLAIDRGDVRAGLERLRDAARAEVRSVPPDALAAALAFGLGGDFAAALPLWRECLPAAGLTPASRLALRAVVDGCLTAGDLPEAWAAWREIFVRGRGDDDDAAFADAGDRRCVVTERRWLRGRLERLWQRGDAALRAEIEAVLAADLDAATADGDAARRVRAIQGVVAVAGQMAVGMAARERLVAALSAVLEAAGRHGEPPHAVAVQRDLLLLDLAAAGDEPQRTSARAAIAGIRRDLDAATAEDPATAWPLGRVEVRRSGADRGANDEGRSRLLPLEIDVTGGSFVTGLAAACDVQQSRLAFLDRFGRRFGESVAVLEGMRLGIPAFDQAGIGARTLGRVVYVWSGGTVTAVELSSRGHRRLWSAVNPNPAEAGGRRVRVEPIMAARNGGVPLGMRIVEPGVGAAAAWGVPVTAGLPVVDGRTLSVFDPVTGAVLWERHGLPSVTDVWNDDRVVCLGTADGRRGSVFSLVDGRLLHEIDLPDRRRRLLACGSRILAIGETAGPIGDGVAETVRLEVLDVVDRSTTPLGEFPGESRACSFAAGMAAIVDPRGRLTILDVAAGRIVSQAELPAMPPAIDLLEVRAWADRLVVCVGRQAAAEDDAAERNAISPLQQMLIAGVGSQPLDFSVWAVDRVSGDVLWQAPATVRRHCLLAGQPAGLPVLVFARQIQQEHDREQTFLSVLALDTRTGHAVFEDDRIPAQPHLLFGCAVSGDPGRHAISLREHGGDPQRVTLEFTGGPTPPRPPHQAAGRPAAASGIMEGLNRMLERALPRGREP